MERERDWGAWDFQPSNICCVAAAAIIGGVATVGSSLIGSSAAKSAANTQANAARDAAAQQMAMFQTIRGDLAPYRSFGGGALPGLSALLGYGGTSGGTAAVAPAQDWGAYLSAYPDVQAQAQRGIASGEIGPNGQWKTPEEWAAYHFQNTGQSEGRTVPMTAGTAATPGSSNGIQTMLENLPGYQFTKQQGLQAVTNRLGAQGLGGMSGAYGKGIARFVTGLADQTYGEQITRLQNAATMGQNAANQTGTFGQQAASNAGSANLAGAGAVANSRLLGGSQIAGGLQTLGAQFGNMYGGFGGSGSGGGGVSFGGDWGIPSNMGGFTTAGLGG